MYWAIAEGYASEMAARRTAMENATKNAGEMIQKLTLVYNRSRQATITNDLVIYIYFNFRLISLQVHPVCRQRIYYKKCLFNWLFALYYCYIFQSVVL